MRHWCIIAVLFLGDCEITPIEVVQGRIFGEWDWGLGDQESVRLRNRHYHSNITIQTMICCDATIEQS